MRHSWYSIDRLSDWVRNNLLWQKTIYTTVLTMLLRQVSLLVLFVLWIGRSECRHRVYQARCKSNDCWLWETAPTSVCLILLWIKTTNLHLLDCNSFPYDSSNTVSKCNFCLVVFHESWAFRHCVTFQKCQFAFFLIWVFSCQCNKKRFWSTPRSYIMLWVPPGTLVVNLETVYEGQRWWGAGKHQA